MMINLRMILEKAPEGATHYTDGVPSLNVYVKVVHLDGFYLHLAGKWERYPAYAEMKSLDDLRRTLELQGERDALAVQAGELLRVLIQLNEQAERALDFDIGNYHALKGASCAADNAITATPQQHLAEIRAEAGRAGFVAGIRWRDHDHDDYLKYNIDEYANQYADQIRRGDVW